MRWINHGERTVYANPWVTVNVADVEVPGGRRLTHTVMRQRPAAMCVALNARAEVLLLYRHRFITDTWAWEVPGGCLEVGESLEQAAARELLEETGWKATGDLHHLVSVETANGISDASSHVYWTDQAQHVGEPMDGIDSAKREWVALADVPAMVADGQIRAADSVAGLLVLVGRVRPA